MSFSLRNVEKWDIIEVGFWARGEKDMANIIAVVWDFDKTLVDGYMQDPIFEEYNVESKEFWKEVNSLPDKYMKEQSINE